MGVRRRSLVVRIARCLHCGYCGEFVHGLHFAERRKRGRVRGVRCVKRVACSKARVAHDVEVRERRGKPWNVLCYGTGVERYTALGW